MPLEAESYPVVEGVHCRVPRANLEDRFFLVVLPVDQSVMFDVLDGFHDEEGK